MPSYPLARRVPRQQYKYSLTPRGRLAALVAGGYAAWEGLTQFDKLIKSAEKSVEQAKELKRIASQQLQSTAGSMKKIHTGVKTFIPSFNPPSYTPITPVSTVLPHSVRTARLFGKRRFTRLERLMSRKFMRSMKRKNVYRRL